MYINVLHNKEIKKKKTIGGLWFTTDELSFFKTLQTPHLAYIYIYKTDRLSNQPHGNLAFFPPLPFLA